VSTTATPGRCADYGVIASDRHVTSVVQLATTRRRPASYDTTSRVTVALLDRLTSLRHSFLQRLSSLASTRRTAALRIQPLCTNGFLSLYVVSAMAKKRSGCADVRTPKMWMCMRRLKTLMDQLGSGVQISAIFSNFRFVNAVYTFERPHIRRSAHPHYTPAV